MAKKDAEFPGLGLKGPVGPMHASNKRDVLRVKEALHQSGHYPIERIDSLPEWGLYEGIQNFQRKAGLKVDGVIKPGGPTEGALAANSPTYRCILCGAPHGGLRGPLCPDCYTKLYG